MLSDELERTQRKGERVMHWVRVLDGRAAMCVRKAEGMGPAFFRLNVFTSA